MQISSIYSQLEPLKIPQRRPARSLNLGDVRRMADRAAERVRLVAMVRANGFSDCRSGARLAVLRKYLKSKGVKF